MFREDTSLTPVQQLAIMAFAARGTVRSACDIAGCTPREFKEWQNSDKEFITELSLAMGCVADTLEQEAIKRAMDGSDKLMLKMLEGWRPERYAPKTVANLNVSGSVVHSWQELALQAEKAVDVEYKEAENEE
jgi:hypothetical protein